MIYSLYTDGGSRGNPGPAGIGGQILDQDGNEISSFSEYIGIATNNIAEYKALIKGLNLALSLGLNDLKCLMDSELVVKQIRGEYKVKDEKMKELHGIATHIMKNFKSITISHVLRNMNKNADKFVNNALDESFKK